MGRAQDVGAFGHEVHPAEHDELGFGMLGGVLRQLERIALDVRELDDVLALVVVAENDDPGPQLLPRGANAGDQRRAVQIPVLAGNVLLPVGKRRLSGQRNRRDGVPLTGDARQPAIRRANELDRGDGHRLRPFGAAVVSV